MGESSPLRCAYRKSGAQRAPAVHIPSERIVVNCHVKTAQEALKFVQRHGVVLEAGRGPVANLAEAIAGGPIRGSWWGHPKGKLIFRLTRDVRDAAEILVCRLVEGKITFVHRRLWPALVQLADSFDRDRLAALHEVHTASGAHKILVTPYPKWVPPAIRSQALELSAEEAARQLGTWVRRHA